MSDLMPGCRYCGMFHMGVCSRVKAMEFYPDGTVKRVELHPLENSVPLPPAPAHKPPEGSSVAVVWEGPPHAECGPRVVSHHGPISS